MKSIPRYIPMSLNKMLRGAAVALCMALLTACSAPPTLPTTESETLRPAETQAPETTGNVQLRLGMSAREETINPYRLKTYKTQSLLGLVYETMLTLDSQGMPQPGLCESWQVQEDGSVLFAVRKNVTFHNGETLTAQHIVDALTYIRDEAPDGACGGVLNYVRSFRVSPDRQGVILVPRKGLYPMLCALTVPIATLGERPSGTGPYQVSSFEAGVSMTLTRSETWWRVAPQVETIYATAYESDNEQLRNLALGQTDMAYTRDLGVSAYRSTAGFTALSIQTQVFDFLAFNLREGSPTADRALRQALFRAMDSKALVEKVYKNGAVAAQVPVTAAHWVYDETLPVYGSDADAARRIMGQSAHRDHNGDGFLDAPNEEGDYLPIVLRVLTVSDASDTTQRELAKQVEAALAQLGVLCEQVSCKGDQLEKTLQDGEFDIAVLSADLGALPDLSMLYGAEGALNFTGYNSPEMEQLLLAARQAGDVQTVKDCYGKIYRQALSDLPIMGIALRCATLLYDSSITGVGSVHYTNPFANVDDWRVAGE